ncbi:MAG TPA: PAS domain S-box protein [Allocoleopsis sp.]
MDNGQFTNHAELSYILAAICIRYDKIGLMFGLNFGPNFKLYDKTKYEKNKGLTMNYNLHQYQILDHQLEQTFTDMTNLAAHICNAPFAFIGLFDEQRQWFKSQLNSQMQAISSDIAFCAYASSLQNPEIFIIHDTLKAQKFNDKLLSNIPEHIRFYVGFPLRTSSGDILGNLCVIDYHPRELTEQQLGGLQILGKQIVNQIELRRNLTTIKQTTTAHKQIEDNLKFRLNLQAVVATLGQYALMGGNLDKLMNDTLILITKNLQLEYGKILEFIPDNNHFLLKAGVGWSEGIVGNTLIPGGTNSQAGYTLLSEKEIIVEDLTKENRFKPSKLAIENKILSGISVIIHGRANPFGVLSLHTNRKRKFTENDVYFLQAIANILATAIERKQSELALEKAKDELEMRVQERTAELSNLNQRLQLELAERKQVELALIEAKARFSGILEIADDAIISIDSKQNITLFNKGAEKIFGYLASEVLGKPLDILLPKRFNFAHKQNVVQFGKTNANARRMGERTEVFGRRKDGREFIAEASISQLEIGGEKLFTAILRDVSKRKQYEEELERLNRKNELILNSAGEGIFGLNLQSKITFVNPAGARLLGYQVSELLGKSIEIILAESNININQFFQSELVMQVRNELFKRQDGSIFPVEYISNLIEEQHEIVGVVIAFKDITERNKVERMKNEFISIVSHELRTPLTSIYGSLKMLGSGLLNTDADSSQRLLEIAIDSTERLMRLINDILDIERIESGKVVMSKNICNIENLMMKCGESMQPFADKYKVNLIISPLKEQVNVDEDRIMQTFTNLLSNGIKFSPEGGQIWLTAKKQENYILFEIKDQGRGIPEDKLESIFEKFQQVDFSDSRNHEGTGLGLAICRSIIEQHEGKIWAESVLGAGSTFYFTLPLN